MSGNNYRNSIRAARTQIEWVETPAVCGTDPHNGVSHSIGIDSGGGGWVQVGWRYYGYYPAGSQGYCERVPNPTGSQPYGITNYVVSADLNQYSYFRGATSDQWECRISAVLRRSDSIYGLGFSSGPGSVLQAEAHVPHAQLGRVAPSWLDFKETDKVPLGSSGWDQMSVLSVGTGDPVWNYTQPIVDGFLVNTDANH